MLHEGQNAGVTGLLNLPGAGVKFQGNALAWSTDLSAALMDAAGRGDSEWPEQRPLSSNGFISVSGTTNLDGAPVPTKYRGELGTLRLTQTTGVYQEYPVRVRSTTFKKQNKETGLWPFTHVCQIVSDPTFTGYGGTQTASASESLGDKFLWANLLTTVDLDGLDGTCKRRILVWGLTDSDAAEKTKIDAVLAALVAPYAGMKVRLGTFTRLSKNACLIDVEFGYTTTAEDILNAASEVVSDPNDLTSHASTAAFNTTPAASGSLIARETTTKEYNDAQILHTTQHGTRDTKDDREMPGTFTNRDPSDLTSTGQQTGVYTGGIPTAASVPSGLQKVDTKIEAIDRTNNQVVYQFAKDTSQQKEQQNRSFTRIDPQGLETEKAAALMDATPSTPTGTVERNTHVQNLTNDHTITTVTGGLRSTADDRTFGRTKISTDISVLSQETYTAAMVTTGASYSAPSAPTAGMVNTEWFDVPDTSASTTNKSVRVYVWSLTTNAEKLTLARYSIQTDPNGLDTVRRSAVVWDGVTPPSDPALTGALAGFKLDAKDDIGIPSHPTKLLRWYRWAKTDSVDRLVLPRTKLTADPSNIISNGEVAALNSTPSVPGGYKSRGTTGFYQNGTDILNVIEYGLRSNADDITHGDTVARTQVFEGTTLDSASLLASTNAANIIAASLLSTYKNNTTFEGATVKKLHDGLAEIILHTRDDQIIVRYRFWGTGQQLIAAYWDGSDVYVFVAEIYKISTGRWYFELAPNYRRGGRGELSIDRRVNGSSVNLFDGLFDSSNISAFLGLGAGKVSYVGPIDGDVNILVPAPRASRIVYGLEVNSNGFVDMRTIAMGWQRTTTDISGLTPFSWVKASDLGITASVLDQQDYSGFIT